MNLDSLIIRRIAKKNTFSLGELHMVMGQLGLKKSEQKYYKFKLLKLGKIKKLKGGGFYV